MNGNDFTIIDKDFAHLHQLRSLDLQEMISFIRITVRNGIKFLIFKQNDSFLVLKSFCKRSKVQIISPETFKNNTLLEKLNLGLNLFTGIGTDDVEEVNEKYNFSNVISGDAFEKLENLKLLNFGFSKITFVGSNAFRGLKNLERLNIEFNQLTDLTGHTFEHLKSVKVINLHGNHLESIGSDVFEGNNFLEKIDFAKNKLKWLPSGLFKNCKHLTELNFERNQIDKIANLHINHLSNLHILDLTFNRIGKNAIKHKYTVSVIVFFSFNINGRFWYSFE